MPQYERHPPLLESGMLADPFAQLERWLQDAAAAGLYDPTAMTLATVGADGRPSARVVLFKGFHDGGLCFYTNYESRKGRDISANPEVALAFWWDRLERQVRIEGRAEKLPPEISDRYFQSRPRASQLAACTSRQSCVVASREELDARIVEVARRYAEGPVPRPPYWGGYVVRPHSLEFWQGRRARYHDRIRYVREGAAWRMERLEP